MVGVSLNQIIIAVVLAAPAQLPPSIHNASHHRVSAASAQLPAIAPNDNRQPAGSLSDGVLTLELRAQDGLWRPEGASGRAIRVEAFGNGSSLPSVPAPLIRVHEGTTIVASVRNDLAHALRVHGLCDRSDASCTPIDVPAGEARHVQFKSGPAGTYHYWATSTGMPLPFRAVDDTQLSGALIVDPPGAEPAADRIFVITDWTSLTRDELQHVAAQDDPGATFLKLRPDVLFVLNGRAWPRTERLSYRLGERVRWRVVNLSTQAHPMHLHGFYFQVDSLGDGMRERVSPAGQQPSVVTQLMPPGSTLGMTWIPERVGNWLFHCHIMTHVSPTLRVDGSPKAAEGHDDHHASAGMTGMVLGITITPGSDTRAHEDVPAPSKPRKLTLQMQSEPRRFGNSPAFGFRQVGKHDTDPSAQTVHVPGPTLVLKRGEPVEITLVNRLPESTAIHWHGMELDSYYDGVHGWSGSDLRMTPLIEPGASFVVRFTPPRAGTFMYHTHLHDRRQLTSGLYGAMLVLEPEETFDATTDHVMVIGRGGPEPGAPIVINGEAAPKMVWKAAARHRVRVINITPDDIVSVSMQTGDGPIMWQPLTKDGAPVPSARSQAAPAKQVMGVGEIYDFEVETPAGRRTLWFDVRSPGGKWHAQGQVIVK